MLLNFCRSVTRAPGLPRWLSGEEPACQCKRDRRCRFSPWVGRSLGEGNGNPFLFACLGSTMDRGAWQATVHGVAQSQTWPKWLRTSCTKVSMLLGSRLQITVTWAREPLVRSIWIFKNEFPEDDAKLSAAPVNTFYLSLTLSTQQTFYLIT